MNKKTTLKKTLLAFILLAATSFSNVSFSQTADAALTISYGEYTVVPNTQITPITIGAKVTNNGGTTITATPIFTRVYLNPNLTTPITTFTQNAASTAPGATSTVTMGVFTPTVIGDYVFYNYITTGDVNKSNDTVTKVVTIDLNEYAHDSGTSFQGIGVAAGGTCVIGSTFNVVNTARMDSVMVFFNPPTTAVGNVVQIKISAVVGSVPSLTSIGESAPFTLTAAQCTGTGAIITLPVTTMSNTPLQLTPGNYFVGFSKNTAAGPNYGLQCAVDIFTPGTVFGSINGAAYVELNSLLAGFNYTPIMRPYINRICLLTATASAIGANCGGSDGSSTVTPTNGLAPYTYLWSNGQTNATATNLSQGNYSVVVTDAYGCNFTVNNIVVSNITTLALNIASQTNVSCFGLSNGTATVNVVAGNAPFTYTWTNSSSTTTTASNLIAGVYSVNVIDATNCSFTTTVTITEPLAVTVATTSTPATVGSNGTATATPTGGTAPYSFLWSNGATTQNITGLAAGTYSVIVTDSQGCVQNATVIVANFVSVTEIENGSFSIFPNPSQGIVTVSMDGIATGDVTMEIIDITGKSVFIQKVLFDGNKTNYNLDLSSLEKGTYLIKLKMQEGTVTSRIILAD
jgi:hypothetical protein